jgi:hypothetical protein
MKYWLHDKKVNLICDLKRIHTSMTIWFNGVVGMVALYLPELLTLMPQLQEYMEAPDYATWMKVLLIGNFLLRFKTTKAMRDK